ncbi:MAG: tRNA (adenosine(37)-N6)-threonylcarbamoyltransferase complex dimerization subunit type 1 TsaB [Thermodesulfobacteriota bacterium]
MKIVGIDTSSFSGSVSIVEDNNLLGECLLNIGPRHSENIVASIDWLLKTLKIERNELDAVSVSIGPGSFTSLRVGVTIAKSLAYTLKIKIVGVSSLEVLASNIPHTESKICSLMDAKREEVYSAVFEMSSGGLRQVRDSKIQNIEELCSEIDEKTIFLGDAAAIYGDDLKNRLGDLAIIAGEPFNIPRSSNCAIIGFDRLNDGIEDDPITLVPDYLRKSVVGA